MSIYRFYMPSFTDDATAPQRITIQAEIPRICAEYLHRVANDYKVPFEALAGEMLDGGTRAAIKAGLFVRKSRGRRKKIIGRLK